MSSLLTLILAALLLQSAEPLPDANALADAVMNASGAQVWPRVTRIRFTFNVEREGKTVASVSHDWDVRAGTDTVITKDTTVTVNVRKSDHSGDEERAYARFINDSYWLLAPLKVKDPGVKLSTAEMREIDGKRYLLLHLRFENVGLTPTDQYDLWVDPETKLVRFWDFMPEPGKSSWMSWEDYREFNGLKLATKHVSPRATIIFTDVAVTVE